jgi:hypothetical protein
MHHVSSRRSQPQASCPTRRQDPVVPDVDIRFIKRTELETIPAVGEVVTMSAGDKLTFPCKIVQRSWHESKNLFVLACEYGGSGRISKEDYATILDAPDWTARPLL